MKARQIPSCPGLRHDSHNGTKHLAMRYGGRSLSHMHVNPCMRVLEGALEDHSDQARRSLADRRKDGIATIFTSMDPQRACRSAARRIARDQMAQAMARLPEPGSWWGLHQGASCPSPHQASPWRHSSGEKEHEMPPSIGLDLSGDLPGRGDLVMGIGYSGYGITGSRHVSSKIARGPCCPISPPGPKDLCSPLAPHSSWWSLARIGHRFGSACRFTAVYLETLHLSPASRSCPPCVPGFGRTACLHTRNITSSPGQASS